MPRRSLPEKNGLSKTETVIIVLESSQRFQEVQPEVTKLCKTPCTAECMTGAKAGDLVFVQSRDHIR